MMAAADEAELVHMVANPLRRSLSLCRYPRGEGVGIDHAGFGNRLEIGRGPIIRIIIISLLLSSARCRGLRRRHPCHVWSFDDRRTTPFAKTASDQLFLPPRTMIVLITIEEGSVVALAPS